MEVHADVDFGFIVESITEERNPSINIEKVSVGFGFKKIKYWGRRERARGTWGVRGYGAVFKVISSLFESYFEGHEEKKNFFFKRSAARVILGQCNGCMRSE